MKASELKQIIENMISQYGDLEIVFRNEYKNNIYDIKDVMINFSRNEDDKYIITNHYYQQKKGVLSCLKIKILKKVEAIRIGSK